MFTNNLTYHVALYIYEPVGIEKFTLIYIYIYYIYKVLKPIY
jgi:hypothetical protein